ncbi:MAG: signal peptide peptidase SppA [Dethiobacter sp.]|nr:signal peptide peptidase SppA [Dethiobacter sp.]MBS3898400.1 signal peptide peptidase SppA [Dethiobacter sp.]MBS3982929.1 signal peptide peptidase SppA [Dethiobacter sp.]
MNKTSWIFLCLSLLVIGSLVLAVVFARPQAAGGNIGIITLTGPIAESVGGSLQPDSITPAKVRKLLELAEDDSNISAVVLRVNSPGGSVGASQEIGSLISNFPRPVVVSMADMATSGGLYISVFADHIVAQEGTITGSIGVILSHMYLGELYEKLGITAEVLTAGKYKGIFSERLNPERREILQVFLDDLHNQFIQAVAEGREVDAARVEEIATGEVFTGSQAQVLGLVDSLGGLETAIEQAAALAGVADPEPVEIILPPVPWWEELGGFPAAILERITLALLGKDGLILQQQLENQLVPRW